MASRKTKTDDDLKRAAAAGVKAKAVLRHRAALDGIVGDVAVIVVVTKHGSFRVDADADAVRAIVRDAIAKAEDALAVEE